MAIKRVLAGVRDELLVLRRDNMIKQKLSSDELKEWFMKYSRYKDGVYNVTGAELKHIAKGIGMIII